MKLSQVDTLDKNQGSKFRQKWRAFQWKKLYRLKMKLEIGLVLPLILIVWGLLSLPIIFYHLPVEQVDSEGSSNGSIDTRICSQSTEYLPVDSMCFLLLDYILEDSCPQDASESILIVQNDEEKIFSLNQFLQDIKASEDCSREVVPFLCQYFFGLCSDSGYLIQPTSSQCDRIKNSLCQREWKNAVHSGYELPHCNNLPSVSSCPLPKDNYTSVDKQNSSADVRRSSSFQNQTRSRKLECSPGFYRENGSPVCHPSCYSWTQDEKKVSVAIDVFVCGSALVGFLAAIAAIILSFIRHNRMLKFPSVLVVYFMLDALALACIVLISYMDRPGLGLFCSSKNLIESMRNVTPFCIISGMLFQYALSQKCVWWLFHTTIIFWKVLFPFHSRSFEMSGRTKYLHIVCVIIGIAIPFTPIITSMSKFATHLEEQAENGTSDQLFLSRGLGFIVIRFPPILCTGSERDAVFYSFMLPIDLALAFGCTLLLIILWSVHRKNTRPKVYESNNPFKFGTAEKKLLVVFCYFIILSSVAITTFTVITRNLSNFEKNIKNYFMCEQGGNDPNKPCSHEYRRQSYPELTTISSVLLCLESVVNLIFAINLKELKGFFQKLKLKNKK